MGRWRAAAGSTALLALALLYVAVSTLAALQAVRLNLEVIRGNPLSVDAAATTLTAACSIILWILALLLFTLVAAAVAEVLLLLANPEDSTTPCTPYRWARTHSAETRGARTPVTSTKPLILNDEQRRIT